MALRKFTLAYSDMDKVWQLKLDVTGKVFAIFNRKSDATKTGVMRKIIGREGGVVRILKLDGTLNEDRVYNRKVFLIKETVNHLTSYKVL